MQWNICVGYTRLTVWDNAWTLQLYRNKAVWKQREPRDGACTVNQTGLLVLKLLTLPSIAFRICLHVDPFPYGVHVLLSCLSVSFRFVCQVLLVQSHLILGEILPICVLVILWCCIWIIVLELMTPPPKKRWLNEKIIQYFKINRRSGACTT